MSADLSDLLNLVNNPDLQKIPGETAALPAPPDVQAGPTAPPIRTSPPATFGGFPTPTAPAEPAFITPAPRVNKLFFTGRLASGKDFAASQAQSTIFGFADPLYALVTYFYGVEVDSTTGKDIYGVRELLQIFGQWGRGVINEKYPLTVPRALFLQAVQANAVSLQQAQPEVDWDSYGKNPDIWLNACVARANAFLEANPDARVAITNVRFENEFKALAAAGWQHWHCMCSPRTWAARLAKLKLTTESPQVKDTSEQLAATLDQSVIKQVSAVKQGPPLRCIWSDQTVPKPSPRLHAVDSFLKSIGG